MASIKRSGFSPEQNNISDIFKALGHPARIAIIELLLENPVPCKILELDLQMAKSTLSRHIQILFDSGILGYEKIVNETYYSINPMTIDNASIYLGSSKFRSSREKDFTNIYFKTVPGNP